MDYAFKLPDYVGFAGSLVIVGQYLRSIRGTADTNGLFYPLSNLIGCALIIYSLLHNFNPPSMLIEIFWSSVSLYGVVMYFVRRRRAD